MRVSVRLFAVLRDRAGVSELVLEVSEGATVADVAEVLSTRFPGIRDHARHVAYAVNREYVPAGTTLEDGDELAVIPPVSGG
jgi:molybdopterin converting factor subunit 1